MALIEGMTFTHRETGEEVMYLTNINDWVICLRNNGDVMRMTSYYFSTMMRATYYQAPNGGKG